MMIKAKTLWGAVWLYAVLWCAAMFVWVQAAFAQIPGAGAVTPPAPDAVPIDPGVAVDLVNAAHTHKWGLVLAIAVGVLSKVLVWAGRKFDPTSTIGGPVHKILDLPGVAWALPMVGSVAAMIGTSLAAGAPIDVNAIADAVLIGLAAGGWTTKKEQVAQAVAAGTVAANDVATKEAAIQAIKKL